MVKKYQRIIVVSILILSMVLTGFSSANVNELLVEDDILVSQKDLDSNQIASEEYEKTEFCINDATNTEITSEDELVINSENVISDESHKNENNLTDKGLEGVTTEKVYEQGDIKYVCTITNSWPGGYNAKIEIYNNGLEAIDNWAIDMVFQGNITNIWNATIEDRNGQIYIIKNAVWNADIDSGCSVSFGFTSTREFYDYPESFNMLGIFAEKDNDDYNVQYYLDNDWRSGFTGHIVITNNSDETIEDWVLSFIFDREITSIWNANIESHEENRYVIKNRSYNANITPGETVSFGFKGNGGISEDTPMDYKLKSININSNSSDDTSYENRIAEVMDRYDESTYDLDTDGDGLKDCEEEIIGTDINVPDTDEDLLSDGDEVYKTWTDPLVFDSLIFGRSDAEADSDGDGITNIEEINQLINPRSQDTDDDELSDYDEIKVYGTDPNLIDTDNDGIEDNHELILGLDPLREDSDNDGIPDGETLIHQEKETEFVNSAYIDGIHISAKATNLFPEVTFISENFSCLNEDFYKVGVLGVPIEIDTYSNIETATISFYLKEGYNVNDYVVLWVDEENSRFVECDTEYDDVLNVISTSTNHFSTYFLATKKKWDDAIGYNNISDNGNFETIVVFDFSKSMGISDSTYADFTYGLSTSKRRIDIGKSLFSRAGKTNKQGVVFFNEHGSVVAKLGSTNSELTNTLNILTNYADGYNTNITTALEVALDELKTSNDKNAIKSIVLVSDGGMECDGDILYYDKKILERAKREKVRIHTVAMGDNAIIGNLNEISSITDGLAFVYDMHNRTHIVDEIFTNRSYIHHMITELSGHSNEENVLGSRIYLIKLRERAEAQLIGEDYYTVLAKKKVQLMMSDFFSYSNPNTISDENWDAFCKEFNRDVLNAGVDDKEIHYFRNKLNRAPATLDELFAEKENWELMEITDSLYHLYGEDGLLNTKFISNELSGKYEGVYDKNGLLLTEEIDPKNMGTYNYCGPKLSRTMHGFLDVAPYLIWGNTSGCKPERLPRSEKDFYNNQEAQKEYNRIKSIMDEK